LKEAKLKNEERIKDLQQIFYYDDEIEIPPKDEKIKEYSSAKEKNKNLNEFIFTNVKDY
jgi:hypothetical protein